MTLDVDPDDLAGVVDLFGALTRDELETALTELAFKRGVEPPDETVIDDTIESYHLVEYDNLLAVGPTAFPTIPTGATDLPHIMDADRRSIDRDRLGRAVEERFRGEAARALADDDEERIAFLLDLSYDIDTWAPVELASVRERLDAHVE